MSLECNRLTGVIPLQLGLLSRATTLNLAGNQLNGSIPAQLGNLPELVTLNLGWNQLSGSIPPQLGNLTTLEQLVLAGNQLSGSIAPQLGNLAQLWVLNLGGNRLSGSIPPHLGNLAWLWELNLGWNQLSGTIPPELGRLERLNALYLGGNQLSGTIPSALANLTWLGALNLGENQLSGSIPAWLGDLTELSLLDLDRNLLSGSVPASLGNLYDLRRLRLQGNALSGVLPTSLTELTELTPGLVELGYNTFTAPNAAVAEFLSSLDPSWAATQTVPPTGLQARRIAADSVELSWTPVSYTTADGGYYEVFYTAPPYVTTYALHGRTSDKATHTYLVTGLSPEVVYSWAVRSYTPAHEDQPNPLWSAYTAPVAVGTLSGHVALERRGASGDPRWVTQLFRASGDTIVGGVRLYQPGTTTLIGSFAATTDAQGNFSLALPNIPPGNYDIQVKGANTLSVKKANVALPSSGVVDFGTLRVGDANGDDCVNGGDVSYLIPSFGKCSGEAGFRPYADTNADGCVSGADVSALIPNFSLCGPVAWGEE